MKIKDLTIKNFLSVGNATQAINISNEHLTLVLGENLDLGGDDSGARNGVGKCLGINTIVKIRNTITGEIYETTIGELYYGEMEQDQKRKL
jgi:hypothetical protein